MTDTDSSLSTTEEPLSNALNTQLLQWSCLVTSRIRLWLLLLCVCEFEIEINIFAWKTCLDSSHLFSFHHLFSLRLPQQGAYLDAWKWIKKIIWLECGDCGVCDVCDHEMCDNVKRESKQRVVAMHAKQKRVRLYEWMCNHPSMPWFISPIWNALWL